MMKNDENSRDINSLSQKPIDYLTSLAKGLAGAFPLAGGLISEAAGLIIPNQRMDRIVDFIRILDEKLQNIEKSQLEKSMTDEHFIDLLEEGLIQTTRSLSEERRQFIANIITNGLSTDEIEFNESKSLMRILNEISDIEIIILGEHYAMMDGSFSTYIKRHKDVLRPTFASHHGPIEENDKLTLLNNYNEHLANLGLLRKEYQLNRESNLPEFDHFTGEQEIRSYGLTSLGRLLLRQIGFSIY